MISLDSFKKAFEHLPEGAKEAEVNAETHSIVDIAVENGKVADIQVSDSAELFIRVSGEKTGYVYTQNVNEDAEAAVRQAYENSLYSDMKQPESMCRRGKEAAVQEKEAVKDAEELKKTALALEKKFRELLGELSERAEIMVSLRAETYGQHTVNSYGLDVGHCSPVYILGINCSTPEGFVADDQISSDPSQFPLELMAEETLYRIRMQETPAAGFVSGEQEVILSENAVGQMFMTAWQEFSAGKYMDKACCMSGLFGEKVAPDCLSITDMPAPAEGGYPAFTDAEGTEGSNTEIIKNGVFTGMLTNQSTAAALSLPASGNAGRRPLLFGNIATDILVTPKNFCIVPGTSTLEEMEAHMGNGIVITEYFDLFHSLDISSGNFSVPVFGVLVRDGKEQGTVKGLTLTGNFREMLKNITEVGCVRRIHPMDALHNYAVGTCALRVGKLNVSGE